MIRGLKIVAGLLGALVLAGHAQAQAPTPPQPVVAKPAPPVLNAKEVEAFVDSQVIPAMKRSGIPGAIVTVVRRNEVLMAKGYGVADIDTRRPVTSQTLFETASLGKSMTAVVTEQLLEEGKLDLDTDVNTYLKTGKVTGPKVTLRMLLGHRGGFDDNITGSFTTFDGDQTVTAAEMTRRLHPLVTPGVVSSYDNQGYGVIGLILRDVTGKSVPDLYQERLFGPLGMTGTVQGRPNDGYARLARCYTVQSPTAIQGCPYWIYRDGMKGAGGVATSADDLARYMRMLLNGGALDGKQILSPAAYADLTNFDHYRFHPGMPGLGRAFSQFEEFRGLEYAHSGHMPGFSTMMVIYPDADVAIFTSFMGGVVGAFESTPTNIPLAIRDTNWTPQAKPGWLTMATLHTIIADRFIPKGWPRTGGAQTVTAAIKPIPVDDVVGTYAQSGNHSISFAARLMGAMGTYKLTKSGKDGLSILGKPYHPVGPNLWENSEGDRIAAADLSLGRYIAVGLSGGTMRKTNAWETPTWSLPAFLLVLVVLLTGLIQLRPKAPVRLKRLAGLSLGAGLVAILALLAEWQWGVALAVNKGEFLFPTLWRLALNLAFLGLIWAAVRFFREKGESLGKVGGAHGMLIALASLLFAFILVAWRVIGAFPPFVNW
jgi:CubicO group peptidase (beta-lactamase class C family)